MRGSDKEANSKWLESIIGDISKGSATKQLVLGTTSGWLTGFLTMKVGKMVAVAVGGSIIVLQVAQHKGYIKIDWNKVQKEAEKVVDKIEKETTGRGPSTSEKLERFVDRQLDQVENVFTEKERKARRWFESFVNNGQRKSYELQELHIFILSFAAGVAVGLASG